MPPPSSGMPQVNRTAGERIEGVLWPGRVSWRRGRSINDASYHIRRRMEADHQTNTKAANTLEHRAGDFKASGVHVGSVHLGVRTIEGELTVLKRQPLLKLRWRHSLQKRADPLKFFHEIGHIVHCPRQRSLSVPLVLISNRQRIPIWNATHFPIVGPVQVRIGLAVLNPIRNVRTPIDIRSHRF